MAWHDTIISAHRRVTDSVSHSEKLKSDRYFVWQEDGEAILFANDRADEQAITGTTDLFTTQEFDPWADALGAAFDEFGIAWSVESIQYEEDTGFYHYEWAWEVL